jgi:hypothetical protein
VARLKTDFYGCRMGQLMPERPETQDWSPKPGCQRHIARILRASSDACGCAKSAGSLVDPAIGPHGRVNTFQF